MKKQIASVGSRSEMLFGFAVVFALVLAGIAGCRRSAPLGQGKPTLSIATSSSRDGTIAVEADEMLPITGSPNDDV